MQNRIIWITIFVISLTAGFHALWDVVDAAAATPPGERNIEKNDGRSDRMTQTGQMFMKTAELARLAGVKSNPVVGEPSRQSFPVPAFRSGRLHVLFLYCRPFFRPPHPAQLFPPEYLLTLSATGEFIELRPVTPREFGQSHKPEEIIGAYALPAGMTSDQVLQATDRLYRLYDLLLPGFYARPMSAEQEIIKSAKEFKELFRLLSEAPLQPYYRFLGKDFFNWIDQVSRTQ